MVQNREKNDSLFICRLPEVKAKEIFNYESEYFFKSISISENLLNKKIYISSTSEGNNFILGYVYIDKIIKGTQSKMFELVGYNEKEIEFISKKFADDVQEYYAFHIAESIEFDEYLPTKVLGKMKENRLLHCDFYLKNFITYVSNNREKVFYELLKEWDTAFSLDGKGISSNPESTKEKLLQKSLKRKY